jgi:hypothetical protein
VDSGITAHALTNGNDQSAEQLFSYYLYNIKVQKEAGNHVVSDAAKAKDTLHVALLNNINHVTSGKSYPFFVLMQRLISFRLNYFAACFPTGLTFSSVEKINSGANSDAVPFSVANVMASAASSFLLTSKAFFFLLP